MEKGKEPHHHEHLSFEIELGESRMLQTPARNHVIILSQQVEVAIQEYAASDTARELGGVLLGSLKEGEDRTEICVTAMLKAKKTAADKTSLTFTHETWDQIHLEKEILYPDLRMVGWFHTHPGFGIFLSNHDLFIQQNFFNLPWQMAYVVDPVNKEQGFFSWEGTKITPVQYWIADDRGQSVPVAKKDHLSEKTGNQEGVDVKARPRKVKRPPVGTRYIAVTLLVAVLLTVNLINGLMSERQPPEGAMARVNLLENQLLMLHDELKHRDTTIVALQEENQRLTILVDQLSGDYFHVYTVSPGDTLWSISTRYYNDPEEYRLLMRLNSLDDPNSLEVGQRLLLYKQGD